MADLMLLLQSVLVISCQNFVAFSQFSMLRELSHTEAHARPTRTGLASAGARRCTKGAPGGRPFTSGVQGCQKVGHSRGFLQRLEGLWSVSLSLSH